MTEKENRSDQANKLRKRAEETVREKTARSLENPDAMSPGEAQRTLHELELHQIELEMQNEELRLAQAELEVSRARYFDLYDLAPAGYVTLSEQELILEANLAISTLLGVTRDALVKQPLSRFILPADQDIYYNHRKKLLETDEQQVCELRMLQKNGSEFWARLETVVVHDTDGALTCRGVISNITERKLAEDQVKSLLAEKELLLQEVHHRIKNNMNVIMSLLSLQAHNQKDQPVAAVLEDAGNRLKSMSILYDKLYRSSDFRKISAKEYLTSLVGEIVGNFPNHAVVTIETHLDDFILDAKTLSPVGIILNELLTNAMKHAFIGKEHGVIIVSLSFKGNHITLTLHDNGVGIPESIDIATSTGFGMQLIGILTEQLEGTIRLERQNGTKFILDFDV